MGHQCDSCGKGILIGRNVSHAKNRTRKVSRPNLHPFKGLLEGKRGRWRLCTKCLRTAKKIQQKEAERQAEAEKKQVAKKAEKKTTKKKNVKKAVVKKS